MTSLTLRRADSFERVARLLPPELRSCADSLHIRDKAACEELRLRCGQPMTMLADNTERPVSTDPQPGVTPEHIARVIELATRWSVYSSLESIKQGYISVEGGSRIGLCGSAVLKGGEISNINRISSISIRIAREHPGAADSLMSHYYELGGFESTLIVSPPGRGKTSLLRDLVRQLSNGSQIRSFPAYRVSIADERGEIAAVTDALPQLDVGQHSDVLSACPKAEAMLMLLRTMNPEIIAVDEISAPGDIAAAEQCANCGVRLIATAHAASVSELKKRPLYRQLLSLGAFRYAAVISVSGERTVSFEELGEPC